MTPPILLTGGTGTLGRRVAPLLRQAGAPVRILSRRSPVSIGDGTRDGTGDGTAASSGIEYVTGDLATGEGIRAAVAGIHTVVHCAGNPTGDGETTRTLVDAAREAGVRHLAFISVVGADRVPVESRLDRMMFGYFASKRAAERVVEESGLPWTTLRATHSTTSS